MNITIVKHLFKGKKQADVIGLFSNAKSAMKFIEDHKHEDKYNGYWSLSDRKLHD